MSNTQKILFGAVLLIVAALGGYFAFQPAFGAGAYQGIPWHFGEGMSVGKSEQLSVNNAGEVTNAASTTLATTTIGLSYDGFNAGGGINPTSLATGTVITLYTHSGGPALCDASTGLLYADSTGFSPTMTIAVGTTTTSAVTPNLIATTTLATSSDAVVIPIASHFVMTTGQKISALLYDGFNPASSTNYVNWDIEFQVHCWLIGG